MSISSVAHQSEIAYCPTQNLRLLILALPDLLASEDFSRKTLTG